MDAEVARLTADAAAKEASLNELKTKAKAFAEAMTAEKKQLEASLAAAKAELADIKVKAKAFADNVRAQIVAEKDRVHALESQVQAKEAELATLKAQPASPSLDLGPSEADIAAAVATKEREMQQRLDEAMETMRAQLAQSRADNERRLQGTQDEHARTVQMLQEQIKTLSDVSSDVSTASSQWAFEKAQLEQDARNAHTQLEAQIRSLAESHARELEHVQATSRAHVDELTAQLATAATHTQSLQANASTSESASASRATALQETLQTVAGLLEQLVPMATSSDPVALAQALQASVRDAATTQQSLEGRVERLEADKATIESDKTAVETALRDATSALETAKAAASSAQTQLASLQSETSWAASGLQSQLASLQDQLRTATDELHSHKEMLSRETAQKDALQIELNELRMELSHEKSQHKSQSSDVASLQAELAASKAQTVQLSQEKSELAARHDRFLKDEEEKKVKVKQYVQALTTEKQKAIDGLGQVTADLEGAKKAIAEKDGLFEKRMAEIKAKTMDKFADHERVITKAKEETDRLNDVIKKLEAEIKSLSAKKKEAEDETMESLKKKRLAAKTETQKLANDLEGIQRRAAMFADVTSNKCVQQTKQIDLLQEKVLESIHAISHQKKCDISSLHELCVVQDSPRMSANLPGPAMGLTKVDDEISRVFDKMTTLSNVTDRLCDLMLEDGDLSLKDLVIERVVKQFSACFVHAPAHAKPDEAGLLHQRSSSSSTQPPDSPTAT
ncbi:hypothetical protein SDRG_10386 [Saprolegnia diclina VS20]|uniref:Uncharacterized protein n=1 Tax=Saprolegnia diclina (strain VS20) TaxID=1156394 RepID=T0RP49_SAPDV|nr:hypothetical protein SDRG_10386 [Saprolegnia diclina VS20]EQC31867.1 hypothetical protein SDRG_10386 [Saprolegnia diclina VS20]|eukprot:XP_008614595.1 hypothetical protein SDRG_10386 [Saprolegnia diclina VS20]